VKNLNDLYCLLSVLRQITDFSIKIIVKHEIVREVFTDEIIKPKQQNSQFQLCLNDTLHWAFFKTCNWTFQIDKENSYKKIWSALLCSVAR